MQSIPKGITREHVLAALAELDAGAAHGFGPPTGFDLVYKGRSYPPKAAIGLAARHAFGTALEPSQFSSGTQPGQAVHYLRRLGFEVVEMREDWSDQENDLLVADYFDMLRQELMGKDYNKTAHRQRLMPLLQRRSSGSVEFKHQNLSAVLVRLGLPYIDGYKPRFNKQGSLALAAERYLRTYPGFFDDLVSAERIGPRQLPPLSPARIGELFVPPPEELILPDPPDQPWLRRNPRMVDFARRDAENRELGKLGEKWTVELERRRLREARRDDLARKVEWVAETCGDGLGFDVLSFDAVDGSERYLEVKTTGLAKFHPFLVTANEVRCSDACPEKFRLYRVFDFSRSARVYVVPGSLRQRCTLDPVVYRAGMGAIEPTAHTRSAT